MVFYLFLVFLLYFFSLLFLLNFFLFYNNNHLLYIALLKSPEVALQSPVVIHTCHTGGGKLHQ